jgi:hypothetical protein
MIVDVNLSAWFDAEGIFVKNSFDEQMQKYW